MVFVAQEPDNRSMPERDDGRPQEPDDRKVLELRIHGVNNTPPAAMLDLPADQVEEVLGDDRAGFWRPRRPEGAPGTGEPSDANRGHVPDGITREAYSWGGLARRSPGGSISAGSKVVAALIAIGWTLLLPFGLANVAYWTRRLDDPTLDDHRRVGGSGAAFIRLFGLCLTSFLVLTTADISMDLVATQCYRDPTAASPGSLVCTRLPGFLGGLATVSLSVRLVVFSAVPIAMLLALWALSSLSRSRYERAYGTDPSVWTEGTDAQESKTDAPNAMLAGKGMWSGDVMVRGLVHLHLAVGFAVLTVCLVWPTLFTSSARCDSRLLLPGPDCRYDIAAHGVSRTLAGIAVAAAALVLAAAVVSAVQHTRDAPDVAGRPAPSKGWLLWLSMAVLAYAELVILVRRPDIKVAANLPGVSELPTALLVLMLSLAAGSLFLRISRVASWAWAVVWGAAIASVTFTPWGTAVVGVVLVAFLVHLGVAGDRGSRRWQAWRGSAPGVFLGTAVLAQGILSSVIVLLVGDWLNGSHGASTLIPRVRPVAKPLELGPCGVVCPGQDPFLTAPLPYLLLAAAAVLTVLVVAVAVMWGYVRSGGVHDETELRGGIAGAVRSARRTARLAHRAEALAGVLVTAALLLVLGAAMTSAGGWLDWNARGADAMPPVWQRPLDASTAAVALLSLAGLGALVKGAGGSRRPLGLVWDLVSFLPRAAHPFAPPCYAERAVPELTERVAWWLDERTSDKPFVGTQRRRGNRVVLSAHSLGGVLTVAALMREPLWRHETAGRIRLLTYGSQLRAYFGRIFPELLGPTVLGTPPSRAASLWSADPWQAEKQQRDRPVTPPSPTSSVVGMLSAGSSPNVLWRNLWHPTDYLGFPVWGFPDATANPVDVPAEEADQSGYLLEVLTHSNYPRTREYRAMLLVLADPPVAPTDPSP